MLAGVRTESSSRGEQEEAALATWTDTVDGATTLGRRHHCHPCCSCYSNQSQSSQNWSNAGKTQTSSCGSAKDSSAAETSRGQESEASWWESDNWDCFKKIWIIFWESNIVTWPNLPRQGSSLKKQNFNNETLPSFVKYMDSKKDSTEIIYYIFVYIDNSPPGQLFLQVANTGFRP